MDKKKKKTSLWEKQNKIVTGIKDKLTFFKRKPKTRVQAPLAPAAINREKGREQHGWISPTYTQSKVVSLDPAVLLANRCISYLANTPEAEAYRILKTQILQLTRNGQGKSIMVTSAFPDEGKTLTSINLALTFAREFQHTVLLVDCDLRKQNIQHYLGCPHERGLGDYLTEGCAVSDLITSPGVEKLALISGGRCLQESAEILGSPRMKELVADMKGRYPERYVIFDLPPILVGSDAQTFAPLVDHILVVVQEGKTSLVALSKTIKFLPQEKIIGFVLNRSHSTVQHQYGYGYGYGYGDKKQNRKQPTPAP